MLLTGSGFGCDLGFLFLVPDDLGFLLWLAHGVELADGDCVAQVEEPGRSKSVVYHRGIDMKRFQLFMRVAR